MKLIIFTDGASRGNPGPASYGFTISDDSGKLVYEEGKYIGTTTNNVAEYTAVLEAFKYVKSHFAGKSVEINMFADSKLVAEQLSGKWRIKNHGLIHIFQQIKVIEMELGSVTYTHVYREKNTVADGLANQALDNL
jgi:ribonuclease HI